MVLQCLLWDNNIVVDCQSEHSKSNVHTTQMKHHVCNWKKAKKRNQEEVDSERDVVLQDPMDKLFWGYDEKAVVCNDYESIEDSVSASSDTYCFDEFMVIPSGYEALWK